MRHSTVNIQIRCALEGVADRKRNDIAIVRPGAEDLLAQQRPLIAHAPTFPMAEYVVKLVFTAHKKMYSDIFFCSVLFCSVLFCSVLFRALTAQGLS